MKHQLAMIFRVVAAAIVVGFATWWFANVYDSGPVNEITQS
jgi:hypothetical protein